MAFRFNGDTVWECEGSGVRIEADIVVYVAISELDDSIGRHFFLANLFKGLWRMDLGDPEGFPERYFDFDGRRLEGL